MEPDGGQTIGCRNSGCGGNQSVLFKGSEECLNSVSQLSGGQIKALYTGGMVGPGVLVGGLSSSLEPIIQSEVSQKEKHQYSILTHIYGI